MDDLHVDSELAVAVVEDKNANAAAASLESAGQTVVQVGLVNDCQALLDITSLGHGNNVAVLEVQDAVLLEDRAEHGLDNHAGSGVGDERGLLVKLAGEKVNTEVAVLASGSRGRDADDLASTSLKDDKVTNADVVARDGDSVGDGAGAIGAARARGRAALLTDLYVNVLVMVMVVARVNNAVSKVVNSLAERVVVT